LPVGAVALALEVMVEEEIIMGAFLLTVQE
jgi:hypothetical protein